jgi:hypothetical protein
MTNDEYDISVKVINYLDDGIDYFKVGLLIEDDNFIDYSPDFLQFIDARLESFLLRVANILARYLGETHENVGDWLIKDAVQHCSFWFSLHLQGQESFSFESHPVYNELLCHEANAYPKMELEVDEQGLLYNL